MALDLTGPQKRRLRLALISAFPSWNELRRLISDQFDMNLAAMTAQANNIEDNAFDLITWADAHGAHAKLIVAARNQNPDNVELQNLAEDLGLSAADAVQRAALQSIVGKNKTFLDVAKWRAALTRAEWRVCRIDQNDSGIGTGFLVGSDLVLTNFHVVPSLIANPSESPQWSCRFDFKLSERGDVTLLGKVIALAQDWLVDVSPINELDFALLRLATPIGDAPVGGGDQSEPRGAVMLSGTPVDYSSRDVIAILQHPLRLPMKLALGMDETLTMAQNDTRFRYKVPTEPGSSGSPVFDGDWNLIGLHHAAGNEAIPTPLIASRPKVAAAIKTH